MFSVELEEDAITDGLVRLTSYLSDLSPVMSQAWGG